MEEHVRICEVLLQSNHQILQQVLDEQTDLLDLLSTKELVEEFDDIGINIVFLCIFYDKPKMLHYLFKRGVNLDEPIDPVGFGTPLFYAVSLSRHRIVEKLWHLGCRIEDKCNKFEDLPTKRAADLDEPSMVQFIESLIAKRNRAEALFKNNILRYRYWTKYRKCIDSSIVLQKYIRRFIAMRKYENERPKLTRKNTEDFNVEDLLDED
jgi:hypothetical protein